MQTQRTSTVVHTHEIRNPTDQHAMQRVTIKVRRELRDGRRGDLREREKERSNLDAFKIQMNYLST